MKTSLFFICLAFLFTCSGSPALGQQRENKIQLTGKWIRMGPMGPISLQFNDNGQVACDFGDDHSVEVVSDYELTSDTVRFLDKEGKACPEYGSYKVFQTDHYLSFDLVDDECQGRIQATMGFWTKPYFREVLSELDRKTGEPDPQAYLSRARVYLALGQPEKAREDLDHYLSGDTTNARAYINRAGTRFPGDLQGVIKDCNKAIALSPDNKNAYFLRGLARYDLGQKQQACQDFSMAIKLGFSVLKTAEHERCSQYWNQEEQ